jgi:hypothetical protein
MTSSAASSTNTNAQYDNRSTSGTPRAYLEARDQHLQANYDAEVIPRHKLWTNDGWLITPEELDAGLPHAPPSAVDRRQRPIPWWRQWLHYLDGARSHGGIRVH